MDKLDQIMQAEENARQVVAAARERADATLREARAQAKAMADETKRETAEQAALESERVVSSARVSAEDIEARGREERERVVSAASQRVPDAASAALGELVS